MRTAPVALAHLGDEPAIITAAQAVSALTHTDELAGEACALLCLAINHAVLTGELDVRRAAARLGIERWHRWLDEAEAAASPADFADGDGYVVKALQAAWCAIVRTPGDDCRQLPDALALICRASHDSDTVAAIAGSLLGARWGASAVPFRWRRMIHGWPGLRARDLVNLALRTASGDTDEWPTIAHMAVGRPWAAVPHPLDDGLLMGRLGSPADVDAVVSLCRIGSEDVRSDVVHHEVWLSDETRAENPNLDFVLRDAAEAVLQLRSEGKRVLVHCAAGASRTPVVSALAVSVMTGRPFDEVLRMTSDQLPAPMLNPVLLAAARALV